VPQLTGTGPAPFRPTPLGQDVGVTLAAVLLDMDGTLVDTEKVWDVALHELAGRYGGVLSPAARIAMVGGSAETTMRVLSEDLGQPDLDRDEGADWLDQRVLDSFRRGVPWRPGAQELLAAVRAAGLPTALVTNTSRMLVEAALLTIGAANFDVIVCGDEVAETKPHPGHYLAATAALGVNPARCVAIEDSPAGVASALAAGCVVLAVPNDVDLSGLDPAVHLRDSLIEVDVDLLHRLAWS
jgi:HAD superfamily hydrolase (TIGR01509 family)